MQIQSALDKLRAAVNRLSRPCSAVHLISAGIFTLLMLGVLRSWIEKESELLAPAHLQLEASHLQLTQSLDEYRSLTELRAHDIAQLRDNISQLTRSRKATFETTLTTQEEQRLLQKQWEVMTIYLLLDESTKKIHLMRGEQSLESYPVAEFPPRALGTEKSTLPNLARITSKERFAHPERGAAEEVAGQLVWNPPQVGTSVRANALGEFVTFTNSALILHGPPQKPQEHEAFPHYCLGLTMATAHKLYAGTFIGTKILLKPSSSDPPAPAPALPPKK